MLEIEVTAGTLEYDDTGGAGPVVVLLHGLLMDGTVFDPLVERLRDTHRCIRPTLPVGSHRRALRPDADLSLRGMAQMVAELLEALDLRDVTLVQNDLAVAFFVALDRPERVGRLVLASCEAFDNYPPGLPGRNLALMRRIPGGLAAAMQLMRVRPLRRLPIAIGWLTKRPIPHDVTDRWFEPARRDRAVRRDLASYVATARRAVLVEATERLREFDRPTLVVWATEDRVMPPEHGRRLAALMPRARLVEIPDSYTLIPWDQPAAFAEALRAFVAEPSPAAA